MGETPSKETPEQISGDQAESVRPRRLVRRDRQNGRPAFTPKIDLSTYPVFRPGRLEDDLAGGGR